MEQPVEDHGKPLEQAPAELLDLIQARASAYPCSLDRE